MKQRKREKPTRMFLFYVLQLAVRLSVFIAAIVLFATQPEQLDIATNLGFIRGFDFVDLAFILLSLDLLTKFFPHAKIAMGSLKQFRENHVPTARLFRGGLQELRVHAGNLIHNAPEQLAQQVGHAQRALHETSQGLRAAGQQFAYSIDVLRMLPWPEDDLTATERIRRDIRAKRMREIVPVAVFWVLFNVVIMLLLDRFALLNQRTVLLWTLFYSVFDMVSVVLWCPLQLVLMRNRCCTTCQIFNWDGMMTVTPLLLVPCWFSGILVLLAVVVLVRWELAFARHPERFDERTNASLLCAHCTDKLCYLRGAFTPRKK